MVTGTEEKKHETKHSKIKVTSIGKKEKHMNKIVN